MSAGQAARPEPEDDAPITASQHDAVRSALRLAAMREHSLLSLSELSQILSAAPDLFHLADLVLFNLMGQYGTSRSALWIRSESDAAPPVLIRSHGVNRATARAIGTACATRPEFREPDGATLADEPAAWGEGVQMLAEGLGLVLLASVPGRDRPAGLIALGTRIDGAPYGDVDRQSLRAALSVVGVAIQSLSLFNRLVENNRELRRANQELQELDRLKSEFLSNVNHELRTPLTIMIGYLESLLDNRLSPEQERRILKVVMAEAMKLGGRLVNLVTFSDVARGQLVLQMAEADLGEPMRRYCEERKPGANLRLREFSWTIEPGLPRVRFDEKRLVQVIDALVDNAIKFTPEGAVVQLRVRSVADGHGRWAAIDVADDGPGIPADRIPTLFEAFRQADGSSTRTIGGMGIGLSFSRQLVHAMGGRLEVESEPERGAVFTVLLPAS